MLIKQAEPVWRHLNSIICVYKPAGVSTKRVRSTIITALCNGLNSLTTRPPSQIVAIQGSTNAEMSVSIETNLADHELVVGPRYQEADVKCSWSNYLGHDTSGVLLLGIREGTRVAKLIRENYPTRCYRLSGKLGEATEGGFKEEQIVEKSTWKHIKIRHFEKLLSAMQASHQKAMFRASGVDLQSQTAYEVASRGLIRPANSKTPIIYGVKCVEFNPPFFMVEIQCVNENESYLKQLVHEIGVKLHSTAHCTGIQCIRHCTFNVETALLRKHWTLQHIVTNMEHCRRVLAENRNLTRQNSAVIM